MAPENPREQNDQSRVASSPAGQGTPGSTATAASGPQHSPLPWRVWQTLGGDGERQIIAADGLTGAQSYEVAWLDAHTCAPANAEFIVRACNSHYAMLEALKACSFAFAKLVAASGAFTDEYATVLDRASAAIQQAEGSH